MQVQLFTQNQTMHKTDYEVYRYKTALSCSDTNGMGGELAELHHHDFYEVYLLLDGEVSYWVDGRIYRMMPGDLLLIHPKELHRPVQTYRTGNSFGGSYERIVLWISPEYLAHLSDRETDLSRCFDTAAPGHRRLIRAADAQKRALTVRLGELAREYYSDAMCAHLLANGIFLQFMVELNRLVCPMEPGSTSGAPVSADEFPDAADGEGVSLVSRVLAYIGAHCGEPLTLDGIADYFFVSKYHLSHTFSREVGMPVYRYITIRRLMLARELLSRGMAAGEVCYRAGFGDYAGFYRAFKAEYGISPREAGKRSAGSSGDTGNTGGHSGGVKIQDAEE